MSETLTENPTNPPKIARKRGNPNWVKGKSANPHGSGGIILSIRDLARKYTLRSIRTLAKNLNCGLPSVEVAAAEALLSRGWGKSPQQIDIEINHFEHLSPEKRQLIDALCAAIMAEHETAKLVDVTAQAVASPSVDSDSTPVRDQSNQ